MSDQDKLDKLKRELQMEWKAPLDVKIIAWFSIIVGIIVLLLGILLITGIAHTLPDHPTKVLFGIIALASDTTNAIYTLIIGAMDFITGYILKKGKKIGWWLAFIGSIYGIPNYILLGFSEHKISALIGILMSLVIIIWLIYRRKLYDIGTSSELKS